MNSLTTHIEIPGGQLRVEQDGSGLDLLLVHSGITDSGMWDRQFAEFARHFRVTRYDMRGFGNSSAIESEYSHADDLAKVIGSMHLEHPRVMAASMGARVVIDYALRDIAVFDRLLLVGPAVSGLGFDDPALHACWEEMTAVWEGGDAEKAIDIETRFWISGPTRPEDADEFVLEQVRRMQRRIVELQPEENLEIDEPEPASGRLTSLAMPILIVVGEHDVSDIHRNAEVLRGSAPDAKIVALEGAGHLPNMEKVEEFNRIAVDFFT